MEGEMRMQIGEYGNRRRDTLPYPVYVTNNKHCGDRCGSGALSLHTCASARAREMIELFRL